MYKKHDNTFYFHSDYKAEAFTAALCVIQFKKNRHKNVRQ